MWVLPQGRVILRCNLSSVQGWVGPYMDTIDCDTCNNRSVTKYNGNAGMEMSG